MPWHKHALIGAGAALLPDAALALFGWRRTWLPESHPLVRLHRFLHSPQGLVWLLFVAMASHILVDWFSPHRSAPHES